MRVTILSTFPLLVAPQPVIPPLTTKLTSWLLVFSDRYPSALWQRHMGENTTHIFTDQFSIWTTVRVIHNEYKSFAFLTPWPSYHAQRAINAERVFVTFPSPLSRQLHRQYASLEPCSGYSGRPHRQLCSSDRLDGLAIIPIMNECKYKGVVHSCLCSQQSPHYESFLVWAQPIRDDIIL